MDHFSAGQWFEYARDAVLSEQKIQMQRHLGEGCVQCQNRLDMWTEALEIGRREPRYHPPSGVVRSAKAVFVPEDNWRWFSRIAQTARVIFDSTLGSAPNAVRGSVAPVRQFVQEARPFVVDLRVECEPARNFVRIIGQVLNSAEPNNDVTGVEVYLLKGDQLAAKASGNASGEFALEFEDAETRNLFLDIGGQKVIEIRLPAFSQLAAG